MNISIRPENLFSIRTPMLGDVYITNSLLSSFIVISLLVLFIVYTSRKFAFESSSKLQVGIEYLYEIMGNMFSEFTKINFLRSKLFSLVFAFFIYILVSNWFGLLPFVGNLGFIKHEISTSTPNLISCLKTKDCVLDFSGKLTQEELIPLFRAPSSDISITAGLALISVFVANLYGLKMLGKDYLSKFFNFSNPINFVVGMLELVSELGKIISFTFRLFGNIFAGEVLLVVISYLTWGLFTLPFMGLEFMLGMIQAFVFFMLTTIFISLASSKH